MNGNALGGRHGSSELRGLDSTPASSIEVGRFGRMFRRLPAAEHDPAQLSALAATMIGEGPDSDHKLGDDDPDENPAIPAGYTYLGQFIDHDITFDAVSSLDRQNDPNALTDFRTPRLDLDSLYGRGPADQPFMYADGVKLLLGADGDLPRSPNGRALIGDPRNDENHIVSQLHRLFQQFHNAMADVVAAETGLQGDARFREAQRRVRWHYQWLVITDFLVRVAGQDVVDDILRVERFEAGGQQWRLVRPRLLFFHFRDKPFMPIEFSVAAYRFGHSMVRPSYHVNEQERQQLETDKINGLRDSFRVPIFSANPANSLNGFGPLPAGRRIDWQFFFDTGQAPPLPQPSYKIDTTLSDPLADLVAAGVVSSAPKSLAERNLIRGLRLGLPSGQTVAAAMGVAPLTPRELAIDQRKDGADNPLGVDAVTALTQTTPLWFYILREAEERNASARLGAVGARIVAEVIIGLIAADPTSYLGVLPNWRPNADGRFTMAELLAFPGVLP